MPSKTNTLFDPQSVRKNEVAVGGSFVLSSSFGNIKTSPPVDAGFTVAQTATGSYTITCYKPFTDVCGISLETSTPSFERIDAQLGSVSIASGTVAFRTVVSGSAVANVPVDTTVFFRLVFKNGK